VTLVRDRNLGELLDATFALYRAHLRLFLLLAAGVVVPVDLIVSGVGLGQLWSGYDKSPTVAAALLPAAVSGLVTVPLITAMLVRAILQIGGGATPSAGAVAREGLDLFAPVLLVVVLSALGVFGGFILLIVPGVILLAHWAVAAQCVAVEGLHGADALRRSWSLVTGNAWWVLGVVVVTNLLAGVLGSLVTLPAAAAAESADSSLILLLATMVVEPFTLAFQALATTMLYFTLLARAGSAPPAGVPSGPPAAADPTLGHPEAPFAPPTDPAAPVAPAPPGWEPPRPGR